VPARARLRVVERDVPAGDAARAQLAQRLTARAHEEPADDRLLVAGRGAPGGELLPAHDRHPHLGPGAVVGGDVDGRPQPLGEPDAQASYVIGPCGRECRGRCRTVPGLLAGGVDNR
jgi:hypothetical protein